MRILKSIYFDYNKINFTFLAGSISFFAVLALFSLSVTIMISLGYIPVLAYKVISSIVNYLPSEISDYFLILINQITLPNSFISLVIAFLSCIWSTSKFVKILIRSFDKIYYFDDSQHKQKRFFAVIFTIGFEILIVAILFFSVLENFITQYLFYNTNLPLFIFKFRNHITMVFPIILLFISFLSIYHFLTSMETNFKKVMIGSIFSSIFTYALSKFFSLYTNVFSSFPTILGSVGLIFALLMWVYYSVWIILLGCYINSKLVKKIGIVK